MRRPLIAVWPLLFAAACANAAKAGADRGPGGGGQVITAEQIVRSGGRTAWEVLKREAPRLTTEDDRNGQPVRLEWRGRSSILLDDPPAVVLDGVRVPDWKVLAQIPADQIDTITIFTGIEGTTYYGTNAASGVIVVRTKGGPGS